MVGSPGAQRDRVDGGQCPPYNYLITVQTVTRGLALTLYTEMRKYRDYLIERLSDREEAIGYFQAALEEYQNDGDTLALLIALRSVAEAQGGLDELARRTHTPPEVLAKILSREDESHFDIIKAILDVLGCRLSVVETAKTA